MNEPLIIIAGADKGGVGKTQVCRALDAYLDAPAYRGSPRKVLDSQYPKGDLIKFCPGAEIVDITSVRDQMKIFDTLTGVTILDVSAGQLGFLMRALDEARLLDDVRDGKLRIALLHVLGPSLASLSEIADATAALGSSAAHFIVKNRITPKAFDWENDDDTNAKSLRALAKVTIEVPHLDADANWAVQEAHKPFTAFITGDASRTLRGYVVRWLERTHKAFDDVGLGKMIAEALAPAGTA